uniref:Glutaredoxin-2, mitochondrial n=1 Tax=Ornithorhynchus anatinus TaxID=9258 RepID=F7EXP9_ORNAN
GRWERAEERWRGWLTLSCPSSSSSSGLAGLGSPGTISLRSLHNAGPEETVSDNCVVIFSKTSCSYCDMAKRLFRDMNVNYTAVELDTHEYGSQFQDALHRMTGAGTVPRIFVNGAFVGGATDTRRLHREGKLLPLVQRCRADTKSGEFGRAT